MEWDFTSKTVESWSDLDNIDIDQELYLFRGQSKYCCNSTTVFGYSTLYDHTRYIMNGSAEFTAGRG